MWSSNPAPSPSRPASSSLQSFSDDLDALVATHKATKGRPLSSAPPAAAAGNAWADASDAWGPPRRTDVSLDHLLDNPLLSPGMALSPMSQRLLGARRRRGEGGPLPSRPPLLADPPPRPASAASVYTRPAAGTPARPPASFSTTPSPAVQPEGFA